MKVLHHPNKELRVVAKDIPITDITSPAIKDLVREMKADMVRENGVGLAATQVGKKVRVFVAETKDGIKAFFNPVITKLSKKKVDSEEGCLSVPGVFGIVERSRQIKAEAYNEYGERVEIKTGGLLAIIFQHEIDHLDGILFIDRAHHIEEMTPNKTLTV